MPDAPVLRDAHPDDAAELVRLRRDMIVEVGGRAVADDWVRRATDQARALLDAGDLLGVLAALPDGPVVAGGVAHLQARLLDRRGHDRVAEVFGVHTDPAWRRRGLGEAVVRRLVARATATGAQVVHLTASPMGEPVYRRLGFEDRTSLGIPMRLEPPVAGGGQPAKNTLATS